MGESSPSLYPTLPLPQGILSELLRKLTQLKGFLVSLDVVLCPPQSLPANVDFPVNFGLYVLIAWTKQCLNYDFLLVLTFLSIQSKQLQMTGASQDDLAPKKPSNILCGKRQF